MQNYSTGDDLLGQSEVDALAGGGVTTAAILIYESAAQDGLEISDAYSELSATAEPTTWNWSGGGAGS
jgi:hypothetical protein